MPRKFVSNFLLTMIISTVCPRLLRASDASVVGAIRNDLEQERKQELLIRRNLAAIKLENLASDEERGVVLFSRGMTAFDANSEQAATNFEAAKKLFPGNSPLSQLTSIYYGRSTVNSQNARDILSRLKAQIKGENGSAKLWKPEQFSIMIEIFMALRLDSLLATTWSEMEARVRPALRDEGVAKRIANYLNYRNVDSKNELISIVESMAGGYPHSGNGRWAFQKLQELQCVSEAKKGNGEKYVFSMSLISRLATNTNLDDGLKQFITELTKGPIRDQQGKVRTLQEGERISFLVSIRLWNEAKKMVEANVERLRTSQSIDGRLNLGRSLSLLGQIQGKQGDHEAAARSWSLYIELFGLESDCRMASENLADSLSRLRLHASAAKIYENLAKSPAVDPLLKWHHFWNTYLAGDYRGALALLDRVGYVPPRDRLVPGGLDYWRAKILEHLHLTAESNLMYKKILAESGDNFYAMLTLARKPSLSEADSGNFMTYDLSVGAAGNSDNGANVDSIKTQVVGISSKAPKKLAARNLSSYSSDMRTISALAKWSQPQIGRRLLRHLPEVEPAQNSNGWGESMKLAADLNDYSIGMTSSTRFDSPLKKIPIAWAQLENHMNKHNKEWRDIYPYAFRQIVAPLAGMIEIDPFLVLSLMRAESVYTEDARSNVGAQGLMQIMPFTGVRIARLLNDSRFKLEELHQPYVNIAYGSYYVKKLSNYYDGNTMLAVAAYNGGPKSVNRWLVQYGDLELDEFIETIPYRETRNYVKSVLRNYNKYKRIWQQSSGLAVLPQGSLPSVPKSAPDTEIF